MRGRNPFAVLFQGFIFALAMMIGATFLFLCVSAMIGWLS